MTTRLMPVALLAALVACGPGQFTDVDAVQLETTRTNPHVGERVHVGATAVDKGGLKLTDVPCAFQSSAPAVAAVGVTDGAVDALSPGSATITATCPPGGTHSASVVITVLPNGFRLTLDKLGNGGGSLFASPLPNASADLYEPGTFVTLSANANAGSVLTAWGGACAGTDVAADCELTMDGDRSASATFRLSEKFVSGAWNADMGSVSDSLGCTYKVTITATAGVTFELVEVGDGTVQGSATTTAHFNVVTTYSPPYTTCTGLPFDVSGDGPISGSDGSLAAAVTSKPSGRFKFNFSGARSGSSISGSASIAYTLQDGGGGQHPVSGSASGIVATKQ